MNRYLTSYYTVYIDTDADSSQQDHNNQCQQYGNDTVCIPVIAEGSTEPQYGQHTVL